jgi:hypothetical protein
MVGFGVGVGVGFGAADGLALGDGVAEGFFAGSDGLLLAAGCFVAAGSFVGAGVLLGSGAALCSGAGLALGLGKGVSAGVSVASPLGSASGLTDGVSSVGAGAEAVWLGEIFAVLLLLVLLLLLPHALSTPPRIIVDRSRMMARFLIKELSLLSYCLFAKLQNLVVLGERRRVKQQQRLTDAVIPHIFADAAIVIAHIDHMNFLHMLRQEWQDAVGV